MKLTILGSGTSQGIPVIACDCPVCRSADPHDKRLRASAMLDIKGKKIMRLANLTWPKAQEFPVSNAPESGERPAGDITDPWP